MMNPTEPARAFVFPSLPEGFEAPAGLDPTERKIWGAKKLGALLARDPKDSPIFGHRCMRRRAERSRRGKQTREERIVESTPPSEFEGILSLKGSDDPDTIRAGGLLGPVVMNDPIAAQAIADGFREVKDAQEQDEVRQAITAGESLDGEAGSVEDNAIANPWGVR